MQRRDEHPTVPNKTLLQAFDFCMLLSNRPAADASTSRAAQKMSRIRRSGSRSSLTATTRSTARSWTSTRSARTSRRVPHDARRGGHHHHCNQEFLENTNKVSRPEFAAFDKHIKTNLPELEGNQLAPAPSSSRTCSPTARSSRSTRFLGRTRFTIGTPATRLCHALNARPAEDTSSSPTRRCSRSQRPLRHAAALPEHHPDMSGREGKCHQAAHHDCRRRSPPTPY